MAKPDLKDVTPLPAEVQTAAKKSAERKPAEAPPPPRQDKYSNEIRPVKRNAGDGQK